MAVPLGHGVTPGLEPAALGALAARFEVAPEAIRAAPNQGVANHTYLLGDELVLRVARAGLEDDLRKEAQVIPAVTALGIRTPAMVAFEEGRAGPFMVVRRAEGIVPRTPERHTGSPWARSYQELGVQLAVLHAGDVRAGSFPAVPVEPDADPRPGIVKLVGDGYLGEEVASWVCGWLDRIEAHRPASPARCLIHGDASPTNLLVDPDTLALNALLDWGDAMFADPAVEFAELPLRAVPYALEGYLGADVDGDELLRWAARILWHHLVWAVFRLATDTEPGAPHWPAQRGNRILEITRFFLERPSFPWDVLQ
ncbi:phosphotransferase family protein [Glycomyces tarimensis]